MVTTSRPQKGEREAEEPRHLCRDRSRTRASSPALLLPHQEAWWLQSTEWAVVQAACTGYEHQLLEVTAGGQGSKTRKKEASMSKEQGRREINTGSALRSTYHMHE